MTFAFRPMFNGTFSWFHLFICPLFLSGNESQKYITSATIILLLYEKTFEQCRDLEIRVPNPRANPLCSTNGHGSLLGYCFMGNG